MNSDFPFTVHGDETLEARIVAWVLGEASAFEAAELERLCEERPELMVFKRRMLALHGLLSEAESAQPDDGWKLPPEKRKALDEIFGDETLISSEDGKEKRIRRAGLRAFLAIAACVVLAIVVLQLVHPVWITQTIREPEKKVDFMVSADRSTAMPDEPAAPLSEQEEETGQWSELSNVEAMKPASPPMPSSGIAGRRVMAEGAASNQSIPGPSGSLADIKGGSEFGRTSERARRRADQAPAAPAVPAEEVASAVTMDQLARNNVDPFADASAETSNLSARKPAGQGAAYGSGGGGGGASNDSGRIVGDKSQLPERQLELGREAPAVTAQPAKSRNENKVAPQDEHLAGLDKVLDSDAPEEAKKAEEPSDHETDRDQSKVAADEKLAGGVEIVAGAKFKLQPGSTKPDLAKLMEEVPAAEDPYSTFSLNISDASFQIAQAALAKGEQPDPAGIKVEQFYNAVDYGDPAPSAGEPVAVSIEQSAHPVIPGRNLVRVALKTAAAGRSASQALRLTLLVDQSGSMVREDRRAAMEKALAGLAGLLTENDVVSVVGFSRTPRLLADSMLGNQAKKLADLVNQSASEGGTNLEEAIKLAEQLAARNQLAGAQNRIVLFTDGAANLGNADPVRLAEKVKQLRQQGIAFDIAGIAADGLNDELLGELARNGNGRYYVVGKGADDNFAKQLAGAFRPAAENVKVQVRFNPERVGRYKLIGFEKDRLKTEDFRNDAVDAAELAAEEAGVAIYQVEPLPGGNGELGEVSVRFRDAASAQMVERTWTIPHESGTPAIDRATPSMQLAVLSMLAAEKLKGGPLADAIDFQQLTDPRANVKRFYGNTGRVGEMLRMLDALK